MFPFNRSRRRASSGSTGTSDGQSQTQSTPPPLPEIPSIAGGATLQSHSSTQGSSQTNSRSGNRGPVIHSGDYAQKCRALMALLRDLRNLGADSEFDLPKIAVIGSQSAGKSSLIEAVTGINVPRDSGTCTRCPMECTMSSAAVSWTCNISLRPSTGGFSAAQPFGPRITNKADVELWLRRAQGAILSTNPDKTQWLIKSANEIKQAIDAETDMRKFTEDTIVVDIRDQGLTDLSFVDLPGLIQNAEQDSIDLIHNLSSRHVEGENTLILVTIPVIDDIQNAGAVKLAKASDPDGRRTIVVLTKPDLLGPGDTGAQESWKRTMRNTPGSPNYLQHGYYCVRLPNDHLRQQGYTAHNLPDPNYFDITKPWNEVGDRGRFGVSNLVRDISAHLVQLIETNLPRLRAELEAALKACSDRLAQLPPLPQGDHSTTTITLMINAFLRELGTASVGDSHKSLAQECRRRYVRLRKEVFDTCPEFKSKQVGPSEVVYDSDSDNGSDDDNRDDKVYDIVDVRKLIEDCTGWELPGFIPYETYERLIQQFVEGWKAPTQACFEDIYIEFSSVVNKLADDHFSGYRNLKTFVSTNTRTELEKSRAVTEAAVQKLLDIEKKPFFSQRSDFKTEQTKWMGVYHGVFYPYGREGYFDHRDELHVMATVRAYFQFAYERFSDTLLLMVEHELVQALTANLETTIFGNLMDVFKRGAEGSLLAEDPNVARDRRELTSRKERLMEIRRRLESYSMS
ncbi:hypothetical protein D9756_009153 [Leucocoprinus leucothites]|uniref:Uncharacterized protein n=1 Tax=Leucocoprinus leucothites TaxID=201217 RepID=A0A8H5FV02_9AGAR|nr:hypothetical protein D9756_009153 [Leucoagaricus leucothites]